MCGNHRYFFYSLSPNFWFANLPLYRHVSVAEHLKTFKLAPKDLLFN